MKRDRVVAVRGRRGARPKVSETTVGLMIRKACTGRYTSRDLRNIHARNVRVRRIQQLLSASADMSWLTAIRVPPLTADHRNRRLKRGASHWKKVIWSDEKRFSLDGLDGLRSCWASKRRAWHWHSQRQAGSGSVMMWRRFRSTGSPQLSSFKDL